MPGHTGTSMPTNLRVTLHSSYMLLEWDLPSSSSTQQELLESQIFVNGIMEGKVSHLLTQNSS